MSQERCGLQHDRHPFRFLSVADMGWRSEAIGQSAGAQCVLDRALPEVAA